ncbi:MAG: leucine-rich repeat domain-containing protein [Clostridia bacterium]|nr:leucine-rich repeat domain-containing protein [Clostridia bacterium]
MKNISMKILIICLLLASAFFIFSCNEDKESNLLDSEKYSFKESVLESEIHKPYQLFYKEIEKDGNYEYVVTGIEVTEDSHVEIPSTYNGYPVTKIEGYAFKKTATNGSEHIISVVIPDSVTAIGYNPFQDCKNLISVTIGDGLESFGLMFDGCTSLETLKLGKGIKYIGARNFPYNIKNIIISEENPTLKTIDGNVYSKDGKNIKFYSRGKIEEQFYLPDGVTNIDANSFYNCKNLKKIIINKNVEVIDDYAFFGNDNLESFEVDEENEFFKEIDGNLYTKDGSTLLECAIGDKAESFVVPASLKKVKNTAFSSYPTIKNIYVTDLRAWCKIDGIAFLTNYTRAEKFFLNGELVSEIVVPDSVTSLKSYVFANFTNIESVDIGDGVTVIEYNSFYQNSNVKRLKIGKCLKEIETISQLYFLERIDVDVDNPFFKAIDGNLYSKDGKTIVLYTDKVQEEFTMPSGVAIVGANAFYKSPVKKVYFPDGLERIEVRAFAFSNIESIEVPESVTYMGTYAFSSCNELKSVVVNSKNVSLYDNIHNPFEGTKNIVSITIPANLMTRLPTDNIEFARITSGEIVKDVFARSEKLQTLIVDFGVTKIGDYTFMACKNLKTVKINCPIIGNTAFSGCTSIEEIDLGEEVVSIGDYAFSGCVSATKIRLRDKVQTVGVYAFSYCSSAFGIIIGSAVESIGSSAFRGCSDLSVIYYKGSLEEFNNIVIGELGNEDLVNAERYYYVENEEDVPLDNGNYWHYPIGSQDYVIIWGKDDIFAEN